MTSRENLWRVLVLAVVLSLGLALRLAAMHDRVLLDDEVGTARCVSRAYGEILSSFQSWMTQPAYIALARLSGQLFGTGEFALRLPSLIFGLIGIVAVWMLGCRLGGVTVGGLAAVLLALHPYHLFYSQMARAYVMMATLATLSFWLVFRIIDRPTWTRAAGLCLCLVLLGLCHLAGSTVILGEILVLLVSYRRQREPLARRRLVRRASVAVAGAILLLGLLYRPVIGELVHYTRDVWGSGAGGFSLGFLPLGLEAYMGGRGISIYLFSVVGLIGMVRLGRRDPRSILALAAWPSGLMLALWLLDSGHFPWSFTRFFFFALPALVIAAAAGLEVLMRLAGRLRPLGPLAGAAPLVVFLACTSGKSIEIAFGPKDPHWPTLLACLRDEAPAGALLVSMPVRFSSLHLYREVGIGPEMVELPGLVKLLMDERSGVLRRKLIFIVDLVPLNGTSPVGLDSRRVGQATLLHRPWTRAVDEDENLKDLEALLQRYIAFVEQPDRCCLEDGWVYWRIVPRHEHLCVALDTLAQPYAALALVERRLGKTAAGEAARAQVAHYLRERIRPGQITASWRILAPHVDIPGLSGD